MWDPPRGMSAPLTGGRPDDSKRRRRSTRLIAGAVRGRRARGAAPAASARREGDADVLRDGDGGGTLSGEPPKEEERMSDTAVEVRARQSRPATSRRNGPRDTTAAATAFITLAHPAATRRALRPLRSASPISARLRD